MDSAWEMIEGILYQKGFYETTISTSSMPSQISNAPTSLEFINGVVYQKEFREPTTSTSVSQNPDTPASLEIIDGVLYQNDNGTAFNVSDDFSFSDEIVSNQTKFSFKHSEQHDNNSSDVLINSAILSPAIEEIPAHTSVTIGTEQMLILVVLMVYFLIQEILL